MSKRMVTISKFLSKYLRHEPAALGLTLQLGGWVSVDELLAACRRVSFAITYDELIECVETSDKQRFAFSGDGELIRANQGHSVEVDLELFPKEPPAVLYHGTVERFLTSIMSDGLQKRQRHHVHMSADTATAEQVGARRGDAVILQIDAAKMHLAGHTFYESANHVWLTDSVPPKYLQVLMT